MSRATRALWLRALVSPDSWAADLLAARLGAADALVADCVSYWLVVS